VASNLTIESPNFEKINKEAGQHTADAINLLWAALNETRKDERVHYRLASEQIAPKVLIQTPSASVDNLDLEGASIVSFQGSNSVNLTGFRAPDLNTSRVVIVHVSGAGTITAKHNVTSEALNRLSNASGADVTLATGGGIIFAYIAGAWREVA
jgi:hypothetical protein